MLFHHIGESIKRGFFEGQETVHYTVNTLILY
jgi:hypothetical protein